jgi:tripartite-type tricarboxylate transporter receptor subunit TctC
MAFSRFTRLGALALAALVMSPETAALAADFYAGKTVTVIAGYRPGGGVDNNARLVGAHIGKFIPGNPTVINKNMPGAAGGRLANHMFHKADPDGLMIALPGRTWMFSKLFKEPGVRYDPLKFAYIGSPGPVNNKLWIRADLGIRTIADLKKSKRQVVYGGLAQRASNTVIPRILGRDGFPIRALHGYKGTSNIMLAIEQKEVDGIFASESTLRNNRGDLIDNKVIIPLLQAKPFEPGLPLLDDQLSASAKPLAKLVLAASNFGVIALAPPVTPKARVDILRKAYSDMMKDAAFKADAAKRAIAVEKPLTGEEVLADLKDVLEGADQKVVNEYLTYVPPAKKKGAK